MKKYFLFLHLFLFITIIGKAQELLSSDGKFNMSFSMVENGKPAYVLTYKGKQVIKQSTLGLELKSQETSVNTDADNDMKPKSDNPQASLFDHFTIIDSARSAFDENWIPVWGEVKSIRNNYNELVVILNQESIERKMIIRFRLFDDGLGFRYEFPQQKNI